MFEFDVGGFPKKWKYLFCREEFNILYYVIYEESINLQLDINKGDKLLGPIEYL